MKYSLVLPCKDEAKTIGICISKAYKVLGRRDLEIIVVDNNSRDNSAEIAKKSGAIVVKEKIQGYGAALLKGFSVSKGDYIIMCDSDNTYDIEELPRLLKYKNYDIVIGNRFKGKMQKGAMSFLHRYIGNPLLSFVLRTFYGVKTKDTHCGFRVIKSDSLKRLDLQSAGMELASEMLLKASKKHMKIKDVPISYGARIGSSKLSSFKDGWKHLRLMLLYSPDSLYLVPGIASVLIGLIIFALMLQGPISIIGLRFYIHPTFIGSMMLILGFQILLLWLFAKTYMITYLDEQDKAVKNILKRLSLEKGVIIGLVMALAGFVIHINILMKWIATDFGRLNDINSAILGLTLIILGIQAVFSSFYLSILGMKNERR